MSYEPLTLRCSILGDMFYEHRGALKPLATPLSGYVTQTIQMTRDPKAFRRYTFRLKITVELSITLRIEGLPGAPQG